MSKAIRVFVDGSTWELVRFDEDQEPRIRDLDLAERLGFERAYDVRELIQRHAEQLSQLGVIRTVRKTSGERGGRPGTEYWLTQKQATLVAMKSETLRALELQVAIVHVFDAAIQGQLPQAQHSGLTRADLDDFAEDIKRELRGEIHNARLGVIEQKAAKEIREKIVELTTQAMSLGLFTSKSKAAFAINRRVRDACSFPLADGGWDALESRLFGKAKRMLQVITKEHNGHIEALQAKAAAVETAPEGKQVVIPFPIMKVKAPN